MGKNYREQKLGLEFEKKEYDEIDKYCREVGIDWFASAWDLNSLKFLKSYRNTDCICDDSDLAFLDAVAKQKNIPLSALVCAHLQILMKLNIFKKNNCSFELMHCISATHSMILANLNMIIF